MFFNSKCRLFAIKINEHLENFVIAAPLITKLSCKKTFQVLLAETLVKVSAF